MVAVEVGDEDLFDLVELNGEALDAVLGAFTDIEDGGGGGGEDHGEGGVVAREGRDGGGCTKREDGYRGRHLSGRSSKIYSSK